MTQYDFGIDLGTTNSAIVGFDGENYKVFKNRDQMEVTPSAIKIDKNGRLIVGRKALESAPMAPHDVALEFKRLMGTKDHHLFTSSGRKMTPEELSSEILKSLISDAQKFISDKIDFAVITIPAAFRALQCEATNKAAQLAGLRDPALLMEPIAASVGFAGSQFDIDDKWIVYDLGGGTFDVAVVAHQNNILSVLEHSGNNMLGGKNIDEKIIDQILIRRLHECYHIPNRDTRLNALMNLRRRLKGIAEVLKIDLSTLDKVAVDIFDIGKDEDGKEYEISFTVDRSEIDNISTPMIMETIYHCREVLNDAGLDSSEISRILLVGGPTQMPTLRDILLDELRIALDFSIDPMTAVAKGAALYASTLDKKEATIIPCDKPTEQPAIKLDLSYKKVTSVTDPLIVGEIIEETEDNARLEICFESGDGFWNSPWVPIVDSQFETNLYLREHSLNSYNVIVRDNKGRNIECDPNQIIIRHGVEFDDFKLPHTISIKIIDPDGSERLDPIFRRNASLPAHKKVAYAADKTILPGSDDSIAIPFFEGEVLDRPNANEHLFSIRIYGNEIDRPIPEKAKIEIILDMNTSRIMTASAYVEIIDREFGQRFVPEDHQYDPKTLYDKTKVELDLLYEELNYINDHVRRSQEEKTALDFIQIKDQADTLFVEVNEISEREAQIDPDRIKRMHEDIQRMSKRLYKLKREKGLKTEADLESLAEIFNGVSAEVKDLLGEDADRVFVDRFNRIHEDAKQFYENQVQSGLNKCLQKLKALHFEIQSKDPKFWLSGYDYFSEIKSTLRNQKEADRLLALGRVCIEDGDIEGLKRIIWGLWELLPDAEAQERAAEKSGIRKI